MKTKTVCTNCGSSDIEYIGNDRCHCNKCNEEHSTKDIVLEALYERTRRAVYATGNRWAIENFEATH